MATADGTDKRILVVEDSPSQAVAIIQMLTQEGYEVDHATDGREGLEKAVDDPPDLVLTDVLMPEMDGFDLCRQIKTRPETQGTPVMLVTQLDTPEDVLKGMKSRADWYVTKPYDRDRLVEWTETLLDGGDGLEFEIDTAETESVDDESPELTVTYDGETVAVDVERETLVRMLLSLWELASQEKTRADATRQELAERETELEDRLEEIRELKRQAEG